MLVFNPFDWYANLINQGKIKAWYFIFVLFALQIASNFFQAILIIAFFGRAPSPAEILEILAPYHLILAPVGIAVNYVTGFLFSFWKTFIGKIVFILFILLAIIGFLYALQQFGEITGTQPNLFGILGFVVILMGYWRIFLKMPAEGKLTNPHN